MGVLSEENNILDGGGMQKEDPDIKPEPYFDEPTGDTFEPDVNIKVEPEVEQEEKYVAGNVSFTFRAVGTNQPGQPFQCILLFIGS